MTRFVPALTALLSCVVSNAHGTEKPFRYPEGKIRKQAELTYRNGIPVLVVEGAPEEIGNAIGKLALKPGRRVLGYPQDLIKRNPVNVKGLDPRPVCKALFNNVPKEYRIEADAMIKASGVPAEAVILGNTSFDLGNLFACSSLLVESHNSATGEVVFGRNLDLPSLGYLHQHSLVTVYRPKGKRAFVSIGFPGLLGCLSGMNDAGLSLAVHENQNARAGEDKLNLKGIPFAICYRRILEECRTIRGAEKLLKKLPRTRQTNLCIADRTGVAVFEVTPKSIKVRRAVKGVCVCTNHFCTELAGQNGKVSPTSRPRFAILSKARNGRKLRVSDIHNKLKAVAAQTQRSETIQAMIFEPRTLKLHLGLGRVPATHQKLVTLELAPLLNGKKN